MVQERKGEDGMKDYDERLRTLQEQAARKTRLEAKLAEVNRQKKMLQEKEEEWEKKAAREQRDVEQLEGASLSSLYYAIIGKKGEKLDKEKAEAYAARVKLETAKAELDRTIEEISRIQAELAPIRGCEQEYQKTLRDKRSQLQAAGGRAAEEIFQIEEHIGYLENQEKEVKEAVYAGRNALRTSEKILSSLSSAESWSTWDLFGGGLWSDMAKHSELDLSLIHISSILILLMPQPTKSTDPTGGVMLPKHILKISITPNWILDIPRLSAIGRKIGVKIKIAGVISINIPTIRRITFISRKITYGFSDTDIIAVLIAAGIPEYAITKDIAEEAEIKNRMMPLVHALFTRIFINDFTVMLL